MCWLAFKGPLLIVKYENLYSNLRVEMKRILTFLNIPIYSNILDCVSKNRGDSKPWHNPKSTYNPYVHLNNNILQKIRSTYSNLNKNIDMYCEKDINDWCNNCGNYSSAFSQNQMHVYDELTCTACFYFQFCFKEVGFWKVKWMNKTFTMSEICVLVKDII